MNRTDSIRQHFLVDGREEWTRFAGVMYQSALSTVTEHSTQTAESLCTTCLSGVLEEHMRITVEAAELTGVWANVAQNVIRSEDFLDIAWELLAAVLVEQEVA